MSRRARTCIASTSPTPRRPDLHRPHRRHAGERDAHGCRRRGQWAGAGQGTQGGGAGGQAVGILSVTPGASLTVTVGQGGAPLQGAPTYGGGAVGGGAATGNVRPGGAGGGMSAIWQGGYGVTPLLIAGGGGGAPGGSSAAGSAGGAGGGTAGAPAPAEGLAETGRGGSQTAGGAAGTGACTAGAPAAGTQYAGGVGGGASNLSIDGGGGGRWRLLRGRWRSVSGSAGYRRRRRRRRVRLCGSWCGRRGADTGWRSSRRRSCSERRKWDRATPVGCGSRRDRPCRWSHGSASTGILRHGNTGRRGRDARRSGAVLCTATVTAVGTWSCTSTSDLAVGANVVQPYTVVNGQAFAGNAITVTVPSPSTPVITGPEDGAAVADSTPTFTGTGDDGDTITSAMAAAPCSARRRWWTVHGRARPRRRYRRCSHGDADGDEHRRHEHDRCARRVHGGYGGPFGAGDHWSSGWCGADGCHADVHRHG